MTEAERLLLLLVADAMLVQNWRINPELLRRVAAIRHAMDDEAHAARQSAPQGGHQDADVYYDALQADAASDAHSPGKGGVG